MADKYSPAEIEGAWQRRWQEAGVAYVDTARGGEHFYMLNMFPYPSGSRLHVGHGRNYILGDALYRRERMAGHRVLNPMCWDAFGLPAENAAIASGIHHRVYTEGNLARMLAGVDRVVLGGQSERVVAHRMQHPMAGAP
ncbi:MAG TPA: class I tRNA ligase family protein, partial [Thermoanaerobaculia bacterium]